MLETGNNPFTDKRLSICVSAGGFSFLSAAAQVQKEAEPEQLLTELRAELERYTLVNNDFSEVTLLVDGLSTRIPLNEFRSEEVQSLFRLTYGNGVPEGTVIRYEVLGALELVEVYALRPEVEDIVKEFFPSATTRSMHGQVLLNGLEAEARMPLGKRRMHASVGGSQLMLFTFVDNRLNYCNTFATGNLQGRLYYTLYVWTHLELAQERDILVLHGSDEEFHTEIKNFIRDIECV